ncbi:MAG: phosphoribosyl-AMP cyclohydrolase [Clostridiaceae bacterium]|nr:phosphoribosyl-AMP cyclohydrolase [Clostridiaceae bacterium]
MPNILEIVKYNADGLIPAVTQDIRTDEVLMLAYMNEESLKKTIETGKAHYFSRSRQKLWLKGETSGHIQKVRSISIDCDSDTLLLKVEQTGAACHTGHRSCFFTRLEADELRTGANTVAQEDMTQGDASLVSQDTEDSDTRETLPCVIETSPCVMEPEQVVGAEVLGEVFDIISDRRVHPKEGSYTNYLFTKGLDKILKKIGEEACEVVIASKNGDREEISSEIADLLYHIMVLLAERSLTLDDIFAELGKRK